MPPTTATAPQHTAAAGPAITEKLSIDQLVLDSPIKRVKDKNNLEFLEFKYTDNDGKVYKCVLPAAMARTKRTGSEWLATFSVYRRPEVLARKPVKKSAGDSSLRDFPFISPKPEEAKAEPKPEEAPRPIQIPALQPLPTERPPGPPGAPGPMPEPGMPPPRPGPTGPAASPG